MANTESEPREPTRRRSRIVGDGRGPGTRRNPDYSDEAPRSYLIELNVHFPGGVTAAAAEFQATWDRFVSRAGGAAGPPPRRITDTLFQCVLSYIAVQELIRMDGAVKGRARTIFKAWRDYALEALVDRSAPTVKVDAARRAFGSRGKNIVWAVMDSGIESRHPHFSQLQLHSTRERKQALTRPGEGLGSPGAADQLPKGSTFGLHYDFTDLVKPEFPDEGWTHSPLTDPEGHGTHVAGIIAGACPPKRELLVRTGFAAPGGPGFEERRPDPAELMGMAPHCQLVSLKVMRSVRGMLQTTAGAVIAACEYVRRTVNVGPSRIIHGVNLSFGCDWRADYYAAGQSPLCRSINDLVASGVVVVVSAGNGGAAEAGDPVSVLGSITEPGHAEDCITVGSTHREAPYAFGVTYTSSRGPTLDGRRKPDVVAPGEWITSAATGRFQQRMGLPKSLTKATYAEDHGTSMAAPHVSGVVAAFLSARPEFIGRPRAVRELLFRTCTDLGREPYAQGHGLVDLMRMLSDS